MHCESNGKVTGCKFCSLRLADIDCVDYETGPTPKQEENITANWAESRKENQEDA